MEHRQLSVRTQISVLAHGCHASSKASQMLCKAACYYSIASLEPKITLYLTPLSSGIMGNQQKNQTSRSLGGWRTTSSTDIWIILIKLAIYLRRSTPEYTDSIACSRTVSFITKAMTVVHSHIVFHEGYFFFFPSQELLIFWVTQNCTTRLPHQYGVGSPWVHLHTKSWKSTNMWGFTIEFLHISLDFSFVMTPKNLE